MSHGEFCNGILDSYQMIAGENKNIVAVSLTDAGIQDFVERLTDQLAKFASDEVLILTDIKGGTPYNEAYKYYLSNDKRVRVVAGMNLPMVIELGLSLSNSSLTALEELAIEQGRKGITGLLEEENVEEELEF
ncbi:hypothetical protein RU95_GL004203 [Enterococcus avium]|nr:hypothetical protein RU95_GL004203 [Enterococcus avium]